MEVEKEVNESPLPGAVIIKQGAEGRIYEGTFLGRPTLVKERFSKAYRHPTLDVKLTQKRLQSEVRSIAKCTKIGIDVPALYFIDTTKNLIYMEKVEGLTVRDAIIALQSFSPDASPASDPIYQSLAKKIGEAIGNLHASDIVHGDLTTSNMMLRPPSDACAFSSSSSSSSSSSASSPTPDSFPSCSLVMIDFGLSSTCKAAEDKAVDLYVLERAFLSTHPNTEEFFAQIMRVYGTCSHSKAVLTRLEAVRARGRKKLCFG